MNKKTNVAIVGSGFGVYGLLAAFDMVEGCQVFSICAEKSERLNKYWAGKNPNKIYANWKEMLDTEKPDALAIAVIPTYQFEIAKYALEKGIAVFAEKPLTTSRENSLELYQLAKEKNLPNMVDFMFPEIPEWVQAKKLISQGSIGKVTAINVNWSFLSYDLKNNITSWKTDVSQGGGAISFFFSHVFYYLENFMGKIETLNCKTATSVKSKNHGETLVEVTMTFKSGATGSARLDIDCSDLKQHYIEFQGQDGTLTLQNNSQDVVDNFQLTIQDQKGTRIITPVDSFNLLPKTIEDSRIRPVGRLLQRFINWCNESVASKPNFEDGLRVQELIEQARALSLKNHD